MNYKVFKFHQTDQENMDEADEDGIKYERTKLYSLNDILDFSKQVLDDNVFLIP